MKNIYWFLWTFLWTWHQKLWIVFCSLWIVMTANQLNSLGVLQYHTTKLANVPVMLYAQTTLSQSLWHWPKYTKKIISKPMIPLFLCACFSQLLFHLLIFSDHWWAFQIFRLGVVRLCAQYSSLPISTGLQRSSRKRQTLQKGTGKCSSRRLKPSSHRTRRVALTRVNAPEN